MNYVLFIFESSDANCFSFTFPVPQQLFWTPNGLMLCSDTHGIPKLLEGPRNIEYFGGLWWGHQLFILKI